MYFRGCVNGCYPRQKRFRACSDTGLRASLRVDRTRPTVSQQKTVCVNAGRNILQLQLCSLGGDRFIPEVICAKMGVRGDSNATCASVLITSSLILDGGRHGIAVAFSTLSCAGSRSLRCTCHLGNVGSR